MSDNLGMGSLDVRQLDREWVRLRPSTLESVADLLTDPQRLVWVDMAYEEGVTEELLADVKGRCPSLEGLIPERAARREEDPTKRPPKAKVFRGFVFARMYWLEEIGPPEVDEDELVAQEIHLIAGPSFAITIRYEPLAWSLVRLVSEGVRYPHPIERLGIELARVRDGVMELRDRSDPTEPGSVFGLEVAVALVDGVLDSVFDAMNDVRETADLVELSVLNKKEWLWERKKWPELDRRILGLRRVVRQVRWAFIPADELEELGAGPFLGVSDRDPGLAFKLQDLGREADRANHAVADLIDQVEHTVGLRDSIKTDRLNATTYALTILATVLLVPTLLAGIYGMNFLNMPELRWRYGYYLVLGLMVVTVTLVWLAIRYALRRADLRYEEEEAAARRRSP
jgi:CorA-like Mg2+ transporter protein